MNAIDDHYIQLDTGRWYFDDAACRKADTDAPAAPPCVKAPDTGGSATQPEPATER